VPLFDANSTCPPKTGRSDYLVATGPSIAVIVGHLDLPTEDPARLHPDHPNEPVWALIDTGAIESCIDDQLAQRLGLTVIDQTKCSGVGGVTTHNVYLAYIDMPVIRFGQFGRFTGVHLVSGGQAHQVLLGRTFLQNVVMIYDGVQGVVTVAR